jgi:hypothetical protein
MKIPKRSPQCQVCETPFEAGSALISRLSLKEEPVRFDSCLSCEAPPLEEEISCWKTLMPDEKRSLGLKQKTQGAKALFESLLKEGPSAKLYLLALYLERRRLLVRRDIVEDMILFESVREGVVYSIPNMVHSMINFEESAEDLKSIL